MPGKTSLSFIGLACTAAVIAGAPPASAWGPTGHRVTATIAEKYLNWRAKAAIVDILKHGESLAEAATWPDDMRSSDDRYWRETAQAFHFVTVPHGKTYKEVGAPPQGDAVTALETFKATLLDASASREDKQRALRFTVHIIADLHQPLHAGNGKDKGGNDTKVTFFDKQTNLHWVWDIGLIEREKLSYTEWSNWLSAKITDEMVAKWSSADPHVWIAESVALRDKVYPPTNVVFWKYRFTHIESLRRRLQMSGVRIAHYLNTLFAKP